MTWYVANIIEENLIPEPMPVESRPNPLAFGELGELVYVLYGDLESGVTACVDAPSYEDAERLVVRAFGDTAYIDCIDESASQERPVNLSFVVSTCHDGTDWCIRAAAQAEINNPAVETLPYAEAREFIAANHDRWFDFSSDINYDDDEASA